MQAPILVTGALGYVGTQVVNKLLALGWKVRAADRNVAALTERFGGQAEAVNLDFLDPATFTGAFEGVERMFLMRPPQISMKIAYWSRGVLRGYGGASTPMSPELDGRITVHQGHFAIPLDHPKGPLDFLYSTARYLVSSIALLAFRRLLGHRLVLTFRGIEPGSGKRKVFYIPNALDSSEIHRLDNESFDVAGELGLFVFCGRLAPVKQVPQLIDAFATAIRLGGTRNLYLLTDGESALLFPVGDTRALTDCLLKLDRHLKLYPG